MTVLGSARRSEGKTAINPVLQVLVSFSGTNGNDPHCNLIANANGDLFGTTFSGGVSNVSSGYGTVFEIARTATGYASAPTTLISFTGSNGCYPEGGLIADANGNLFGTTFEGGWGNNVGVMYFGTVFELAKSPAGYASSPIDLAVFTDGGSPTAGLIFDSDGNLLGTTEMSFDGAVFEVAKAAIGYAGIPTTLAQFNAANGARPRGSLITDANGNLFGTTSEGGANGDGTIFEIASTAGVYASMPVTLFSFNGTNGAHPFASLVADANGDLFGTTTEGGAYGDGVVFEIVKNAAGYANTSTTLVSFNGANGADPQGSLIADAKGNLFGTTSGGGPNGVGTVFEITKTATGYASSPITLVNFDGSNGRTRQACLLVDPAGNLFGLWAMAEPTTMARSSRSLTAVMSRRRHIRCGMTSPAAASPTSCSVIPPPAARQLPDDTMASPPGPPSAGPARACRLPESATSTATAPPTSCCATPPAAGSASSSCTTGSRPGRRSAGPIPACRSPGVGDFNGDGTADILLRDPTTGGDRRLRHAQRAADLGSGRLGRPNWQVAGVGDFNGDGTDDILFRDPTTGAIGMFAMHDNVPAWVSIGQADPSFQIAGVGDFNGDGTDDILFRNPTNGAMGDFLMTNGSPTWAPVGQAATNLQVAGRRRLLRQRHRRHPAQRSHHRRLGMFHMTNNVPTWVPIGATATDWQIAAG